MTAALQGKAIKSADRVLDILELFDAGRTALTVMEVSQALNTPQSSTSELLGSLVRRGYLMRRRGERLFRPTSRVALLGAWVNPALFRNGSLLTMMDSLREQTGVSVVLSAMIGAGLKQIHTVGFLPAEMKYDEGQNLLRLPFGQVLLSTMLCRDIRLLVHRVNAENPKEDHVTYSELQAQVDEVCHKGFALGNVSPGWSGIAVLLPQGVGEEELAIGLVGKASELEQRSEELLRSLRQAISIHLGPRVAAQKEETPQQVRQVGQKG